MTSSSTHAFDTHALRPSHAAPPESMERGTSSPRRRIEVYYRLRPKARPAPPPWRPYASSGSVSTLSIRRLPRRATVFVWTTTTRSVHCLNSDAAAPTAAPSASRGPTDADAASRRVFRIELNLLNPATAWSVLRDAVPDGVRAVYLRIKCRGCHVDDGPRGGGVREVRGDLLPEVRDALGWPGPEQREHDPGGERAEHGRDVAPERVRAWYTLFSLQEHVFPHRERVEHVVGEPEKPLRGGGAEGVGLSS